MGKLAPWRKSRPIRANNELLLSKLFYITIHKSSYTYFTIVTPPCMIPSEPIAARWRAPLSTRPSLLSMQPLTPTLPRTDGDLICLLLFAFAPVSDLATAGYCLPRYSLKNPLTLILKARAGWPPIFRWSTLYSLDSPVCNHCFCSPPTPRHLTRHLPHPFWPAGDRRIRQVARSSNLFSAGAGKYL
jgi:hypothetical protein